MRIIGSEQLFFDPAFVALTQLIVFYNAERHPLPDGRLSVEIDHRHPAATLQLVMGWVKAGGEVEDYPLFIRLTESKYNANVLEGVSGREMVSEDESSTIIEWKNWKQSNRTHDKIDDYYYIPSDSGTGQYLKGSELGSFFTTTGKLRAGYALLTETEFVATRDAAQPEGDIA